MEKKYVSVFKIAEKFGVKVQTIYQWISQGKLKLGEDYIREEVTVKRLKVREDLVRPEKGGDVK